MKSSNSLEVKNNARLKLHQALGLLCIGLFTCADDTEDYIGTDEIDGVENTFLD